MFCVVGKVEEELKRGERNPVVINQTCLGGVNIDADIVYSILKNFCEKGRTNQNLVQQLNKSHCPYVDSLTLFLLSVIHCCGVRI